MYSMAIKVKTSTYWQGILSGYIPFNRDEQQISNNNRKKKKRKKSLIFTLRIVIISSNEEILSIKAVKNNPSICWWNYLKCTRDKARDIDYLKNGYQNNKNWEKTNKNIQYMSDYRLWMIEDLN